MRKTGTLRRARWAARACAAGAAVAAAAGTGGAAMAATATAIPIPVPCSAGALASAISGAPGSAILVLQKGCTYRIPGSLPEVTSSLTIEGSGDTITPANDDRFTALTVSGAHLAISHLTFRDFYAGTDTTPGALINDGGTVTIISSRFAGNTGDEHGGAIFNKNGAVLRITSTAFLDNSAGYDEDCVAIRHAVRNAVRPDCGDDGYGGAINNAGTSVATLTSDSFTGNNATENGGAIYVGGGTVTVTGVGSPAGAASDFTGNVAEGDYGGAIDNESGHLIVSYAAFRHNSSASSGGAIENDDGSGHVSGSRFSDNEAEFGGALEIGTTPLNLTDDLFRGNSADEGGAIFQYSGTTTLSKTIVTVNQAAGENGGGGMYALAGTVALTNGSLVTGNTPDNCFGVSC